MSSITGVSSRMYSHRSSSSKSRRPSSRIGVSPVSKSPGKSQEHLYQLYLLLNQEITHLRKELKPLQDRHGLLQNQILSNQKFTNKSRINRFKTMEPNLSVQDDFTSSIKHFQEESNELAEKIKNLEKQFSPEHIQNLEEEVIDVRSDVAKLNQQVQDIDNQINSIQTKTDSYRLSYHFRHIQQMKEDSTKRYHELLAETQKYNQLKNDYSKINDKSDVKVSNHEDGKMISDLKRKLEATRRAHAEKCEELISLRNTQMKEISDLMSVFKKPNIPALDLKYPMDEDDL